MKDELSFLQSLQLETPAYLLPNYPEVYDQVQLQSGAMPYNALPELFDVVAESLGARRIRSVLDLGCGTGLSALPFLTRGNRVHGVDISFPMLTMFAKKLDQLPYKLRRKASLELLNSGRMCSLLSRLPVDQRFDLVMSVCNTVNCITVEADLVKLFLTARSAVKDKGIFIFDTLSRTTFSELGKTIQRLPILLGNEKREMQYMGDLYRDGEYFGDFLMSVDELPGSQFKTNRRVYPLLRIRDLLSQAGWRDVQYFHAYTMDEIPLCRAEDGAYKACMFVARP